MGGVSMVPLPLVDCPTVYGGLDGIVTTGSLAILSIRLVFRTRKAEGCIRDRVLGESTVDVVAGEARVAAQILWPAQAVSAGSAHVFE